MSSLDFSSLNDAEIAALIDSDRLDSDQVASLLRDGRLDGILKGEQQETPEA
jgi:hypothetical protein